MNGIDETVVNLSGTRMIGLIFGSLGIAVIGTWMVSLEPEFIRAFRRFGEPAMIHGFGIFLILLAGFCGLYGVRKLFGDRRGIVFNEAGILDCTHGISAGLIPWNEIAGAEIIKLPTSTVLAVKLKEPAKYLERQGPLKRVLFEANQNLCGSPIALSIDLFKAKPSELLAHFSHYQEKYGNA